MNARRAFQILAQGVLRPDGHWEDEGHKLDALHCRLGDLSELPWMTRAEQEEVLAARLYRRANDGRSMDGRLSFDSVYDLVMYFEIDLDTPSRGERTAYRGQADHRWPLVPSLCRDPATLEVAITGTCSWIYETVRSRPVLLRYSPLELIAIAQHYGSRTCLLDYTFDARTAAAFACLGLEGADDAQFGAVFELDSVDVRNFAWSHSLPTGTLICLRLDEVPRIRKQNGVFFGASQSRALENLTGCDAYLFRHSGDSRAFLEDTQLTAAALLPVSILDEEVAPRSLEVPVRSAQTLADEARSLLAEWSKKFSQPMSWESYYEIATNYVSTNVIGNDAQVRRLRAFCRFYALVQEIDIPTYARSIRYLRRGAHAVEDHPELFSSQSDECERYRSQFSRTCSMTTNQSVFEALREAKAAEGLPYDVGRDAS
jgi:hypothetical protein